MAPRLERALTLTFPADAADLPGPSAAELDAARSHWDEMAGRALPDWLPDDAVGYQEMVRAAARSLGPGTLAGLDLIVLAMGVPDWRHETMPGSVLAHLTGTDPLVLGVSEQGPAAPFTALRIAASRLATGRSRRALVLALEQPTLPPCPVGGQRPGAASAVALLLAADAGPGPRLGPVRISVAARRGDPSAAGPPPEPCLGGYGPARTVFAGTGLAELAPAPGVRLVTADPLLPTTGVWAELARWAATGPDDGATVLVADRDPALPYHCAVPLTWTKAALDPHVRTPGASADVPWPAPEKELVT
ncbi:hypothetical protein ACX6XY_26625 [Streptomyces sp. O3]